MKLPKTGTISHAAAVLNVTRPPVYELIRTGKLRAYKVGRATRIYYGSHLTDLLRRGGAEP